MTLSNPAVLSMRVSIYCGGGDTVPSYYQLHICVSVSLLYSYFLNINFPTPSPLFRFSSIPLPVSSTYLNETRLNRFKLLSFFIVFFVFRSIYSDFCPTFCSLFCLLPDAGFCLWCVLYAPAPHHKYSLYQYSHTLSLSYFLVKIIMDEK
jgi:hypothetical protein